MALFGFLWGSLVNNLRERRVLPTPKPKGKVSDIVIHEPGKPPRPMTDEDVNPRPRPRPQNRKR